MNSVNKDIEKETAEEYVSRVVSEAKKFYKTPEVMIDENIRLLQKVKDIKDKDQLWDIAVAVSEAYHLVLWVKENRYKRFVLTISSWINKNTTGI